MRQLAGVMALFGLLVVATASPEEIRTGTPRGLGLSADRMGRIDALVQRQIAEGRVVGAVGLVARHGRIAYLKGFGRQGSEAATPMAKDTIFRVYSMTKPITSVALMMLYEEGLFRLEDPVELYLPEFKDAKVAVEETNPQTGAKDFKTVPAQRPIIIRDLLRHTSGISYGPPADTTLGKMYEEADLFNPNRTLEQMVKKLSELPLLYQPGTMYEYGFSVDVAGRLIEVLSHMPYEAYIRERILGPLQMKDTDFYVPDAKTGRFAALYRADAKGMAGPVPPGEKLGWNFLKPPTMPSPGGGLVSTAEDYLRFAQMLLNGGKLGRVRLLSPKTVELMTQNHLVKGIDKPWWAPAGFGLGFSIEDDPGTAGQIGSKGTFGWSGAASTQCWIDPKEDMITILMVQVLGDCPLQELFKIVAYQAIEE